MSRHGVEIVFSDLSSNAVGQIRRTFVQATIRQYRQSPLVAVESPSMPTTAGKGLPLSSQTHDRVMLH